MNNYILEGIIKQAANEAAVRTATMLIKSAKKKVVQEAVEAAADPSRIAKAWAYLKGLGTKGIDWTKGKYGQAKDMGLKAYGKTKDWAKAHPRSALGIAAGGGALGGGGIGYALGDDDDEDVLESLGGGDGLDLGQLLSDNKFALGGGIGGAGLGALMGDSTSSKILGALLGGGAGAGLGYLADKNL